MGRYRPPGVYAQEEVRQIAPSPVPNSDVIAIVSEVPSAAPSEERVRLSGISAVQLSKKGIVGSSVKVFSRDESTEYLAGTDFTVSSSNANDYLANKSVARINNTVTDEAFTLNSGTTSYSPINGRGVHDITVKTTTPNKTYVKYIDYVYDPYTNKIRRLAGSTLPIDGTTILLSYKYGIADGEDVLVKYDYADETYFGHHLLQDEQEIYGLFGYPFKNDGTPNPMALAAITAFANGGPQTQVLCVPVNPHDHDPERTTPTLAEWQSAFDSIVEDEVSMVLETSGRVENQGYLISHVLGASQYNQERIGIIGRDGTFDGTDRAALRAYAEAINHQRIVLVSPSVWDTVDIVNGGTKEVGGQYAAAALAGRITLNRVQVTPTRKPIIGVRTRMQESEPLLTEDSAAGLCVIENKSGFMRVRHGVTTMFSDINQREINVIRAKDFMIKSMREVLDRTVIGMNIEPGVEFLVQGAATNILERMKISYVIADYQTPQVFQDTTDPTRLRLRFEYLPNYAVNEINIEFSISSLGASVIA